MRIGERAKALAALEETYAKTVGSRSSGRSAMCLPPVNRLKCPAGPQRVDLLLQWVGQWVRSPLLAAQVGLGPKLDLLLTKLRPALSLPSSTRSSVRS